jgi:transposase
MARRIHLRPDVSVDELEQRYRAAREPHERSWWQILWLLARGQLAKDIAESTGYSRYWIGQIAKRYNAEGADGMHNRQYTHSHRAQPLLNAEQLGELAQAVRGPAPEGDEWVGRTVAEWMSRRLGRSVSAQVGWVYLVKLEGKRRTPRPRHDPATSRRIRRRKRRSKKAPPTPPRGRDRVPPGQRRALGDRRTPHWTKTDPAQGVVF